jgi:hypothetical protein
MIFRYSLILTLISFIANGQTETQKDSLINEICKTINITADLPDSARVRNAFEKHLFPFANKLNTKDRDDFRLSIFYRLHRSCTEFYKIQYRLNKTNGDIVPINKIPQTKLDREGCLNFLKHPYLFYLESSGDTVRAVIKNDVWIETFKDRTNTKLKFKWIDSCAFELEFIESTNFPRSKASKPGDRYRYAILDKQNSFYNMSVEIVGNDALMTFKIYY